MKKTLVIASIGLLLASFGFSQDVIAPQADIASPSVVKVEDVIVTPSVIGIATPSVIISETTSPDVKSSHKKRHHRERSINKTSSLNVTTP